LGNFANTPQAIAAAPAVVVEAGPEEPSIVWYDVQTVLGSGSESFHVLYRAWTDGTLEARWQKMRSDELDPDGSENCQITDKGFCTGWVVISSPTEGMNAAADINFDAIVDGQDLGVLLAAWGDAPRNPMPASDCPLGLLNP
jgi:hypothetical protein